MFFTILPEGLTSNSGIRPPLLYIEHIQQLLPAEEPRERLQRLLAVHEDDRVTVLQEVLRGRRAAGAGAEVVHEADCVVL